MTRLGFSQKDEDDYEYEEMASTFGIGHVGTLTEDSEAVCTRWYEEGISAWVVLVMVGLALAAGMGWGLFLG